MATKTISVRMEAYERLRRARRYENESFSEVVLRARWPEDSLTGAELIERYRRKGPFFEEQEVDQIEALDRADRPPEDKWDRS